MRNTHSVSGSSCLVTCGVIALTVAGYGATSNAAAAELDHARNLPVLGPLGDPDAASVVIAGTPAATAEVGQPYHFTPSVSQGNAKLVTFFIANRPRWATFDATTGALGGVPASSDVGADTHILITVYSGGSIASLPLFSIQVKAPVPTVTLTSETLTSPSLRLAPRATQQLVVTGTYSDGTSKPIAAADEIFTSSNGNVASVSASGVVTVAANASAGATVTISAVYTPGGQKSNVSGSAVVTVAGSTGTPTAGSVAAVNATVKNNPLCGSPIAPYYWEIGDSTGPLISGSEGSDSSGNPVLTSSALSIASASKWVYATYVTQLRGAGGLSAQDISFLHFTSGYTNMDDDSASSSAACPRADSPDSVNSCLKLVNDEGVPFSTMNSATVGSFYYNGGHMENHASQLTSLGNLAVTSLASTMLPDLGGDFSFQYTEPLMSGGIQTTPQAYSQLLRHMLDGSLRMHDALGTDQVCTRHSATCNATSSPIREAWHYSIGHWVENDPATNGDGAFSSPGAFGFYPWIDATKQYYGVIARQAPNSSGVQQGYASAQCGRLLRHAWLTGVEQTAVLPQ